MRAKAVTAVLGGLLATGALGAGAYVVLGPQEALPGTTIAGTAVGGFDETALRQAVERLADERTEGALPVVADGIRGEIDRAVASVDVEQTVQRALGAGRTGGVARVLGPLLGAAGGDTGREVPLAVEIGQDRLAAEVAELAEAVDREPDAGGIDVRGTTVTEKPPVAGRLLDRPAAETLAAAALEAGRPGPLELPVAEQVPPTTPADVGLVAAQARRALAGSYSLTKGDVALRVTPLEISPLLSAKLVDGRLALRVDLPRLNALVQRKVGAINRPAVEAGFMPAAPPPVVDAKGDLSWRPQPAEVRVVPGANGLGVDVDAATARLSELVVAGERTLQRELPLTTVEPELTTAEAQAAGVRHLIGTFTTYYQAGQPRATNIRRIAEIVDGTYVAPGETFSLNGTAGRRTLARGFVADGAIVDGELTDEVGGGVSQFATTLFNAAFFAGLRITEYQPHSFYISRYPAGRESTVYFGSIDVKFRNDTAHGLHVETSSTAGSVTVALYGDNGGRVVTAKHGPREPRDDGGFRISVTRTVTGGDGVGGRRVFRTDYDPVPPE